MSDKVKEAKAHKRMAKSTITRIQTSLSLGTDWNLGMVMSKLKVLDDAWSEFGEAMTALQVEEADPDEEARLTSEYDELAVRYEAILTQLMTKKEEFVPSSPVHSNHGSRSNSPAPNMDPAASSSIKLPKLDFEAFTGNYKTWNSFSDIFRAIVDKNSSLSGVTKLQYLLSKLKGEPKRLLNSLQVTEQNYKVAWDILNKRYNNKKVIIFEHLKSLFSLQPVSGDSGKALRVLIDTIVQETRALDVMGYELENNEYVDLIICYLAMQKLDSKTYELWNMDCKDNEIPKWKDLLEFIERRCRDLESRDAPDKQQTSAPKDTGNQNQNAHLVETGKAHCKLCPNETHFLFKCPVYDKMNVFKRKNVVLNNSMCLRCLKSGHKIGGCKFPYNCKVCDGNHHSSLHDDKVHGKGGPRNNNPPAVHYAEKESKAVLLATALVGVRNKNNRLVICRALLDNCSQFSIISEDFLKTLGLPRRHSTTTARGVGGVRAPPIKGDAEVTIFSLNGNYKVEVDCSVMTKISGVHPPFQIMQNKEWDSLKLADPKYYSPGKVDMLLGADWYADILLDGIKKGTPRSQAAQNTELVWIIFGTVEEQQGVARASTLSAFHIELDPMDDLKKYWEMEEVPQPKDLHLTEEEKQCEEHFASTHQRDQEGRFMVRIPFKSKDEVVSVSRNMALKRMFSIERKLLKYPNQSIQYDDFLKEYEMLGHMSKVGQMSFPNCNFIPHHYVEKLDSSTTKLRVVFDASARMGSGRSFNEAQMVGPKLQDDLVPKMIRFRKHEVAFVCDVEKMFRQILVHPDDRKYQHILWRDGGQVQEYELNTVTYGTASAPYLATKCVQQLTIDEKDKYPLASIVAEEDAFMDDVVTGDTAENAPTLQDELIGLYGAGKLTLRKFLSNDPNIMLRIPAHLRAIESDNVFDSDESYKTLGISWDIRSDEFYFRVLDLPDQKKLTKRVISSELAKTFDPMGWISPVTVTGKIILQKLWCLDLGWDNEVPNGVALEWRDFKDQLRRVNEVRLKRCVFIPGTIEFELHGFGDASDKAYSACIYLVSIDANGKRSSSLLIAKTKVAPLKQVTTPKLELCAALLVAKLLDLVIKSFRTKRNNQITGKMFAWSDSTTVLGWLQGHSRKWKTFVGNRVAKVQTILPGVPWQHVDTKDNPADCASRGISIDELVGHQLWWKGPTFLLKEQVVQDLQVEITDTMRTEERSKQIMIVKKDESWLTRFSSLEKLIGVTGYGFRIIHNWKNKVKPEFLALTAEERDRALKFWIKTVQMESFGDEIKMLDDGKPLPSSIKEFLPYLDEDHVLRVGGRLKNAQHLGEGTKHPIILPKDSPLGKLIVLDSHFRNYHAGQTLTLASVRQRYWILGARKLVTDVVRKCSICVKFKAKGCIQRMGDLPTDRTNPSAPFLNTGTDFAGPFHVRIWSGRGRKSVKSYICIFVCFATKAVHIELVSELSTQAFLASFERFISIRGKPSTMYSDNGTNYVGAEHELRVFCSLQESRSKVIDYAAREGIKWKFMPPAGPHFGGLWESAVKSAKGHLRKILGSNSFTVEEMTTVLAKVSSCLNSRPLCPMSSQPDELEALTPGHFLIGRPLNSIPQPDLTDLKWNSLDRWQKCQQVTQHFWARWSNEYLLELQRRNKWVKNQPNLTVGDMVVLIEDNQPVASWRLGRVIEVIPGTDGQVRVVKVMTAKGELKRPVVKLCRLPIDSARDEPV